MRTFSLLKGLPVIVKSSGNKIGDVYDISISNNGMVKGLLIKKGALFKKMLFIDIQNITSFGQDGVMIEDSSKVETLKNSADYTFDSSHKLTGKILMSSKGEKLGLLEDVYFQEELGTIVGYECSDGFFSDITEGKRVIKTNEPPTIGKDTIIVNVNEV
ncbi:PRC-barrel domain-containing protein [Cytobacillus sp. FJAT-54145]|uniref:PRC-barrel domain-containing protein n=1 Tax=Cytobacillus spartinae TaxID=3299023 RepID=A0ABW6KGI7_9BACI